MSEPIKLEEQLEIAQSKIDELPTGIYQVSEIFGDLYDAAVPNPQDFGKKFKSACAEGRLKGIEYSHLDTGDKHLYYKIF